MEATRKDSQICRKRKAYRGRLAPTPSGYIHIGHAQTFYIAYARSIFFEGSLVLRVEDLDIARCKPHYLPAMIDDLRWLGISWDFGPGATLCPSEDNTGDDEYSPKFGYYKQSKRLDIYLRAWQQLFVGGYIYPSPHSRKDVAAALSAPHDDATNNDIVFPTTLRTAAEDIDPTLTCPGNVNWRFRVPDGREITFTDNCAGPQCYTAGKDFGDFLVWRADGFPSYELAVVVDDVCMGVTEVVRGRDLLLSTARQLLLYEALQCDPQDIPSFYHCPLVCDSNGVRLAKRNRPFSLRNLRGIETPDEVPSRRRESASGESNATAAADYNSLGYTGRKDRSKSTGDDPSIKGEYLPGGGIGDVWNMERIKEELLPELDDIIASFAPIEL